MRVFISSVMTGFDAYRETATRAARALGHEVKRAEDFGASPDTPQQVCLAGARWAEGVVLILGGRYGHKQKSGFSATHEEYREARGRCPVLVFIQEEVYREPPQHAFVEEVRDWTAGHYTASFRTTEDLRDAVTRALHELELASATGPVDEQELLQRATLLVPRERGHSPATIALLVAAGPRQAVLRPAQLEDPELESLLQREALFGPTPVFDRRSGTHARIEGDALILEQDEASVLVDQLGSVRIVQAVERKARPSIPVLIEEEVRELIDRAARFAAWGLDQIDPARRLSAVVPILGLHRGSTVNWRTRAEHEQSPNTVAFSMGPEAVVVHLAPPSRRRAGLTHERQALVEDFTVLLRRHLRDRSW